MTAAHDPAVPLTVAEHSVDLPNIHATVHGRAILGRLEQLAAMGTSYYGDIDSALARKRRSHIDFDNPATAALAEELPNVRDWLATVPSAAALHPLYHPDADSLPNGRPVHPKTSEWFRNIADAAGIRSRAAVMMDLLEQNQQGAAGTPQQWLSLACGAAQPVFSAMEHLRESGQPLPVATLADLDHNALALAESYSIEHHLQGQIHPCRTNVLNRDSFLHQRFGLAGILQKVTGLKRLAWNEKFDVVDAVGILEYLKPEDWKYHYRGVVRSTQPMAGAVTFLRNAFAVLKPGGLLITGNMLDSHPQLSFTLNVVQWPHIQPRSTTEMLTLFEQAGLSGHLDVYKPTDGVYAVYALRKPPIANPQKGGGAFGSFLLFAFELTQRVAPGGRVTPHDEHADRLHLTQKLALLQLLVPPGVSQDVTGCPSDGLLDIHGQYR